MARTHEEFMNIFNNSQNSINIEILGIYVKSSIPIKCKCKTCGGTWETLPVSLTRTDRPSGCPICRGLKVVKGINDFATKRPDLVKYFVNIEDAYTHTVSSCKNVELMCPVCKTTKISSPNRLNDQGFGCVVCSDNVSYPNKFLYAFLKQLNLDFLEIEKSPEWIKPYRFDSYFGYNGKEYVVEMDGELGHGFKDFKSCGKDVEGLKRDKEKEIKILNHGVELIRIDCLKSDMNYIKNNILKSKLSTIFDLSNIDWIKCNKDASKNISYEICELYNSLPLEKQSTYYMKDIIDTCSSRILAYLKRGAEIGLCDYSVEKSKLIGHMRRKNSLRKINSKRIKVVRDDFIKIYDSVYECIDELNKRFNNDFNKNGILNNCRGKTKTYKGFIFSFITN